MAPHDRHTTWWWLSPTRDSQRATEPEGWMRRTSRATVSARSTSYTAWWDTRSIREQNVAVTAMVAQVRDLDRDLLANDRPTSAWLADWETLVEARERYAADLAAGRRSRFVVPTADGEPLTDRMNSVGLTCEVPPQLFDLQ